MNERPRADDDWRYVWQPVIDAVGTELGEAEPVWGADPVDAAAVRRWCEPLEFASPLHHDETVARAHGHPGIIAPYTSVVTYALPAVWTPCSPPVFTTPGRDAQPDRTATGPVPLPGAPVTSAYFMTDVEFTFTRPPVVGDRLRRSHPVLLGCEPKQTSVGRGAFVSLGYKIHDQAGALVASTHTTFYYYNPLGGEAASDATH